MIDRSNAKRIAYIQVKNEIETNIRNMEAGARAVQKSAEESGDMDGFYHYRFHFEAWRCALAQFKPFVKLAK